MSNTAIMAQVQNKTSNPKARWLRFGFYAAGAILVALTLAYVDGGEEPLHPIVQSVSLPSQTELQP